MPLARWDGPDTTQATPPQDDPRYAHLPTAIMTVAGDLGLEPFDAEHLERLFAQEGLTTAIEPGDSFQIAYELGWKIGLWPTPGTAAHARLCWRVAREYLGEAVRILHDRALGRRT